MPPRTREAALLGAVHGVAELLPVSSSGHLALLSEDADPELRKAFEVAVHGGTALALLIALRTEVAEVARSFDGRRAALVLGSFVPPALAGLRWEGPIERRLGEPRSVAAGLVAGSVALVVADCAPQRRSRADAGAVDGLALGLAQACALVPGVSRNGATVAAARLRGFDRPAAAELSRHVALPVIAGAVALKGFRLARGGLPAEARAPFAAGVSASFVTTLAAAPLVRWLERGAPLWPFALYRCAVAVLAVRQDLRS